MSRTRLLSALLLPLSLAACGEPPRLEGQVTDAWGVPVEGATVTLQGVVEQATTDGAGAFSFPRSPGKRMVQAGKAAYIKNVESVGIPDDPETPLDKVRIRIFPDPGSPGFHLIGDAPPYLRVEPQEVVAKGTELSATTGIADAGEVKLKAKTDEPLRLIFSTDRNRADLAHLNLQLHKLDFIETQPVEGVLGEQPARLNLYVAAGDPVPFDLRSLESDDDYLIVTRNPLPPGVYAFHTSGALTSKKVDALDKTPSELRVVFPFEVTR